MQEIRKEVSLIKDWLSNHNVKALLFDLDGTLLDTHSVFRNGMTSYVNHVVNQIPSLKFDEVRENLQKIDWEAREIFAVSPKRWPLVAMKLGEIYGSETTKTFTGGLDILMKIYKTVPEPLPGALEALATLRQVTDNIGVVTNASEEWTDLKLRMSGISGFFKRKIIVKDTTLKGPHHWLEGVKAFGVSPQEALVIGDDGDRDINAAHAAGIKHKVWVLGTWSDRDSEVPEDTIRVGGGIGKLLDTLLSQV